MSAAPSASVMIVEDERIVARDLQQSLAEMGYDVIAIASSAEEAVHCASIKWPDVVLMDIRIKGPDDGIQAALMLSKRSPVIIIFLTAHSDESMIDRAKRTEPYGYLVKPVKVGELRSTIEVALHRRDLEAAREKLRSSEQRLFAVTNNVPVAIGYFDQGGRVQFANRLFREIVPYRGDAIGVPASTFLGETLYKESYPFRQRALAGEAGSRIAAVPVDGSERRFEVTYLPDHDVQGAVNGVYAIGLDVTERERLTADLLQARVDLEAILNHVPACITWWHADGSSRFLNKAAAEKYGIESSQASGRQFRQVIGETRYGVAGAYFAAALKGEQSSHEQVDVGPDHRALYSQEIYVPDLRKGGVVGVHALGFDTTELRRVHERLRELAQRLETVREEERRRVSMLLHDGIAQELFAMKLGLAHSDAQPQSVEALSALRAEIDAALTKCMDETRRLANELRPVALMRGPLSAVIEEHARFMAERAHWKISVQERGDLPELDEAARLLFFRASQEALTNVARHAAAGNLAILLRADASRLTLEIEDDGVGITDAALDKPRSLGILGLRERFEARGGGLTIARRQPGGTLFTVWLPRVPEPTPASG